MLRARRTQDRTMTTDSLLTIRAATPDDISLILDLIRELAVYEKEPESARATPELLHRGLFGDSPTAEAVIAEWDGAPAGFALFFHNFSTWTGKPGLYLEDLFVRESLRGRGIGQALLTHMEALACDRGFARVDWVVLDWNTPMQELSRKVGASPLEEWTLWRKPLD
jgi:GNAT superfamily N-acetyltransferase